ncbi:prolyl 3-hydroxylase OGFOD1-like [Rhopilema esculentum]|uniref:prolyl 3-hydroxylase OGFOD1-like n=1 Tax=Rhopilema esculentum TaxID=499914 RepID=UPI0031CFCEBA
MQKGKAKRNADSAEYDESSKRKRQGCGLIKKELLLDSFIKETGEVYRSGKPLNSENGAIEIITEPFHCCIIKNLIEDEEFLKELKSDLLSLEFNEKSNDLYKFQQSHDLKVSTVKTIETLRNVLYCDLLSWLRGVTELKLNDTMDLSCAKYEYTDTLLCHDDELEGRRIAFILYLVPPWEEKDGGTLDLFSVDEHGQPAEIEKVLVPSWNSLVFFEVTPVSFHQVSEVLSKEKCRLSVSGWFYGESIPRPPTYIQERKLPEVGKKLEDEILLKWINPMYLDSEIVDAIQNQLEENSEIQLDDFLLEERYMEVLRELESSENEWKMNGPANKRKYETIEYDDKLSPNLKSLVDLMHSEPMFKLLTKLTGLNLAVLDADNNKESVSGTSSKADQEKASAPSCCSEVRRWARGSYTLMHDSDPALKEFALDAMLFFRCDNWDPSFGGFTSYIADSEDEELLTICPTSNCLTLVYRDKETVRFVKHINASCKDAWDEQKVEVNDFFGFYDLSTVYYE